MALLLLAVYLGSERPRFTASLYLTGAVVTSLVLNVVIVAVAPDVAREAAHHVRRHQTGSLLIPGP